MAKVTMLKDAQGSADHIKVSTYKKDQTYDVPDFLAKAFVEDMKVAEFAGRRPVVEAKMRAGAPENKSDAPVVETKDEESPIAAAARRGPVRRQ